MTLEIVLYIILSIFSVYLNYALGLVKSCLVIGKKIDTQKLTNNLTKNGYQDSLTPPISSRIGIINFVLILITFGVLWYEYSINEFGVGIVILLSCTMLSRIYVPSPESNHYKRIIFSSIYNRYANYVKEGDIIRAKAAIDIMDLINNKYPGTFDKKDI